MANDIKITNTINPVGLTKTTLPQERKDHTVATREAHKGDLTVSSHLGSLINTMLADNTTTEHLQRIVELKSQVRENKYHVDIDLLASKLANTLTNVK